MRRVLLPLGELSVGQLAGTQPLVGGPGCITWHSTYETTGTAGASYRLSDNSATSGQELMVVTLSAGASTRDFIALHALAFIGGLWLAELSGSLGGSIAAWVDHDCETWLNHQHKSIEIAGAAAFAQLTGA